METPAPVPDPPWSEARSRIRGAVIAPGDASYDEARRAWNLLVDQHPALIVIAADVDDVVESVQLAARKGLGVSVQYGEAGADPLSPVDRTGAR